MSPTRRVSAGLLTALCAALCGGAGPAFAETTSDRGQAVESIRIMPKTKGRSQRGEGWVGLHAAQTVVNITKDTLVAARFSAESACFGLGPTDVGGRCLVRLVAIKVDTSELTELLPGPIVFDSVMTTERQTARSVDRSVVIRKPGRYRIQAQFETNSPTTGFRLSNFSLTVEKAALDD